MKPPPQIVLLCVILECWPALAAEVSPPATRLKLGIVQMAQATTMAVNQGRILAHISEIASRGARVAVFPEDALIGEGENDPVHVEAGVEAIRKAAKEHSIYV